MLKSPLARTLHYIVSLQPLKARGCVCVGGHKYLHQFLNSCSVKLLGYVPLPKLTKKSKQNPFGASKIEFFETNYQFNNTDISPKGQATCMYATRTRTPLETCPHVHARTQVELVFPALQHVEVLIVASVLDRVGLREDADRSLAFRVASGRESLCTRARERGRCR